MALLLRGIHNLVTFALLHHLLSQLFGAAQREIKVFFGRVWVFLQKGVQHLFGSVQEAVTLFRGAGQMLLHLTEIDGF